MGPLLSVSELIKYYEVRRSVFSVAKDTVKAVDGVSFDLESGKTIGVVGESGSGKSTLARCILLLERPDGGAVFFQGTDLLTAGRQKLRGLRRQMQIIFQDPYSSLNPRMKVLEIITEPLVLHSAMKRKEAAAKVVEVLRSVGLDGDFLKKYPHEMSGGQRQRVAIGRALATDPALIIADEPVSSLDVSIQAQIVNLFLDIRERSGISMIFVSHDLNIVRFLSERILVLYRGKVVETGDSGEVFFNPLHPYTRMLINASKGEFSPAADAGGTPGDALCPYYDKCDKRSGRCAAETPRLEGPEEHRTACFFIS